MALQHNLLDSMKVRRLGRFGLGILLVTLAGGLLHAQTTWSAAAHTGVPTFMGDSGVSNSQTVQTLRGPGVRMRPGVIGLVTVYIPVTVPQGATFTRMSLSALDNTPSGFVKATLYRRSGSQEAAGAQILGAVATSDSFETSGFQRKTAELFKAAESSGDCLFIRLDLVRSQADAAVLALDVELQ